MPANKLSRRDDAELLLGGSAEFTELYRRYESMLLGFFLRRVGRPELAADLAAETFARVIESRARFDRDLGDFRPWLFSIARNVMTRSFDAGRVENAARIALSMQPLVLEDSEIERIAEASGDLALEALRLLPSDQSQAVAGRVLEELSYEELASRLSCSESVVRKRVSRGLANLRSQLEGPS